MPQLNKTVISIVDYGMGNIFSVQKACEHFGFRSLLINSAEQIKNSECLILPGVGAFGDAMQSLNKFGLIKPITDFIKTGKPFLGICLGMQLLFEESEEFGHHEGLGIIKGRVRKFPLSDKEGARTKIPNVGWSRIYKARDNNLWEDSLHKGLEDGTFVYFVHSYYCEPDEKSVILSYSEYAGIEFCSSILKGNIYASQFHPEKSGQDGLIIYKNWIRSVYEAPVL